MKHIEDLKLLIAELENDVINFYDGKNSHGTKARAHCQAIKKICKDLRDHIQEVRLKNKSK